MQFIEMPDLKAGMRLARPIYNKRGVLLYERDSKLSAQTIESVKGDRKSTRLNSSHRTVFWIRRSRFLPCRRRMKNLNVFRQ